jgi:hypothetical protein
MSKSLFFSFYRGGIEHKTTGILMRSKVYTFQARILSKSLFSCFRGDIERKTTCTGILMWSKVYTLEMHPVSESLFISLRGSIERQTTGFLMLSKVYEVHPKSN